MPRNTGKVIISRETDVGHEGGECTVAALKLRISEGRGNPTVKGKSIIFVKAASGVSNRRKEGTQGGGGGKAGQRKSTTGRNWAFGGGIKRKRGGGRGDSGKKFIDNETR